MKRESALVADVGECPGPTTRARAAASCSNAGLLPSKKPSQCQMPELKPRSKRTVLDENNVDVSGNQRKRRTVLQEVTNVCCDHEKCYNASKVKNKHARNKKRVKVASFDTAAIQHTQANQNVEIEKVKERELVPEPDKRPRDVGERNSSVPPYFNVSETGNHDSKKGSAELLSQESEPRITLERGEKGCLFGDSAPEIGPDIIDIDADYMDPQLCSLYAPDIYHNLRVFELDRRPLFNFMEVLQRDISPSMRAILIDWLVEVSEEYKLVADTLYLTVYLIDRFLSQNYIERQRLQLLGITCMLIASKYEEICAPRVEEFCFITDNTYTREEVLTLERQVLKYCRFQVSAPTPKTFLRRFLRAAQALYETPSLELEYLANYLTELTLIDYSFLKFLPSVIAASAVFLARWTLDQTSHPWNLTLEHYTCYKASDLKSTVLALQDLQLNNNGCPLTAIRSKYRQQKFKAVAALSSPRLPETVF